MRKDCYVYAYLREKDDEHGRAGSPSYIGQGTGRRAYTGNKRPVHVPRNRAMIKIVQEKLTKREAIAMEIELIKHYGRIDLCTGCLHNRNRGGDQASPSPSTRRKLSQLALARGIPAEQMDKMQKGSLAAKKTDEYRKHMSEVLRGRHIGKETRKKMSLARLGHKMPEDVRERMVRTLRARNPNPSERALYKRAWRERRKERFENLL